MEKTIVQNWAAVVRRLEKRFGEDLDLQAILFLVGLQELGQSYQKLSKNQKVDVMHIGVCALLSQWGYYIFDGLDADGWPHWKETEKLPSLSAKEQDSLIREAIIEYFS